MSTTLAYCQRLRDEKTGDPAGYSLYSSKQEWRNYPVPPQNLVRDGYPYWCEISPEAKGHLELTSYGVKFDGIAPLPRYLYRWNPQLRMLSGEAPVTIYTIEGARKATSYLDVAEIVQRVFVETYGEKKASFKIKEIVGIGPDCGAEWGAKTTQVVEYNKALWSLSMDERVLLELDGHPNGGLRYINIQLDRIRARITPDEERLLIEAVTGDTTSIDNRIARAIVCAKAHLTPVERKILKLE